MKRYRKILSFLSISISSLFLVLNGDRLSGDSWEKPSKAKQSNQLTISAAASLKNVIEKIEPLYRQKYPEIKIIFNFASSGSLQRQIERGAPVDVFISAADKQMKALEKQGLILTETKRDLLTNQMVLVTSRRRAKSNSKVDSFEDLISTEIATIALGEPVSVPAGTYAQEILNTLEIAEKVNQKAVYAKDARQVLNYVATGNVDAGIIYQTDAQISDRVRVVAIAPKHSHSPVIYSIAAIEESNFPDAARELVEFFNTPEVRAIFKEYGFETTNRRPQVIK